MSRAAVAALTRAEDALRSRGLTGAQAFSELLTALRHRLGDEVDGPEGLVSILEEIPVDGTVDLLGLAYERFFSDLFKGRRGQYFTPLPLVEVLLDLVRPRVGEVVLDPTCGSGGILVRAGRTGATVAGLEIDPGLAELARLNLRLAGVAGEVGQGDFFRVDPKPVDVIVANPPFSVAVTDPELLSQYTLGAGARRVLSDWLFVEALDRWLVPGGRAAVVLPWTLAHNPSTQKVRDLVLSRFAVDAVVALPEGVFRPFGGAAGRALLLSLRKGRAMSTRFANLQDPGWDPSSRLIRQTESDPVQTLRREDSWQELPAGRWVPERGQTSGVPLGELADVVHDHVKPSRDMQGAVLTADLADGDRATGELHPKASEASELRGPRQHLRGGDVLVGRIRPEQNNVVQVAQGAPAPLVGTPEWIAVRPNRLSGWVLHALRTPAWRDSLPMTTGQTRPRTTLEAVEGTTVPWPGEALAQRVDALSAQIRDRRTAERARLVCLQEAVDAWSVGEIDEEGFAAILDTLELGDG